MTSTRIARREPHLLKPYPRDNEPPTFGVRQAWLVDIGEHIQVNGSLAGGAALASVMERHGPLPDPNQYDRARDRGHDHAQAVRMLARACLHVIWRCSQDGVAYDPSQHRALQRVLASKKAAA